MLIPWKKVCPEGMAPTESDVVRLEGGHKKKIEWYRKRKDWEALIQEDELDLEAERVLREVQNYRQEVLFNTEDIE
jgi:hypothetical protein